MYKTIFEKSVDGILILENFVFVHCNHAAVEMFGYKNKIQLLNSTPSELSPKLQPDGMESSTKAKKMIDICLKKGGHRFEWIHQKANKETFWTEIVLSDISKKGTTRVLAILRQIDKEKIQKKEIEKLNKKLKESLSLMDTHIISSSTDLKGVITDASEAFCKISKYSKEELVGQAHNIIRDSDVDPMIYKEMWEAIKNNQVWTGIVKNRAKDNSVYWVDSVVSPIYDEYNQKIGYTSIRQDITAIHNENKLLETMAYNDSLTGIYNRQMFTKILEKEIENKKRHGDKISLMMIDIDHFKMINDTYGHEIGDKVLVSLSKLISSSLRINDVFSRWGGEEFMILLPRTDVNVAHNKAQELRKLIEEYKDTNIPSITISIGVTQMLDYDKEQSAFIRVDEALYKAKVKRNDVVKL